MQENIVDYLLLKMYDNDICRSNDCSSKDLVLRLMNFLRTGYTIPSKVLVQNLYNTRIMTY